MQRSRLELFRRIENGNLIAARLYNTRPQSAAAAKRDFKAAPTPITVEPSECVCVCMCTSSPFLPRRVGSLSRFNFRFLLGFHPLLLIKSHAPARFDFPTAMLAARFMGVWILRRFGLSGYS